jgi:hypothetical protein
MGDYMTSKDSSLSFPVPSANTYSFPNPNPYQPNNMAFSQTSNNNNNNNCKFYDFQPNHSHNSNGIPLSTPSTSTRRPPTPSDTASVRDVIPEGYRNQHAHLKCHLEFVNQAVFSLNCNINI